MTRLGWPTSLGAKVVALQLAVVFVTLVVYAAAIVAVGVSEHRRQVERQAESTANLIAYNVVPALQFLDQRTAREVLESIAAFDNAVAVWVEDGDGRPFASFERRQLASTAHPLEVIRPILDEGQVIGTVGLRIDLEPYRQAVVSTLASAILLLVCAMGCAVALARSTARLVTRPIGELVDAVQSITGSADAAVRVGHAADDELGKLAAEFNHMIDRIQEHQRGRDLAEAALHDSRAQLKDHRDRLEDEVRERTRELAIAKDRAEAADRIKSAFLATMSHELRTPLNSIVGFTGILLQGMAGPLTDEQRKQLGMVQGSARHLHALINDVLDISKIEAGQLEIVVAQVAMSEVVTSVVQTIKPLAERKGIAVRTEIAAEVGTLESDRRRLEQVLLNLVNNGVKFTERGEVVIRCALDGEWLVTAVSDTGIGIAAADLGTLFVPFQQLDAGLSRAHEGTGLGLSISQRLVELLGGTISVASEPGVGSTFSFRLPLTRREA